MTDQLTALRELVANVEAGTLESYAPVIEFALYPFRQKMADVYAANDAYKDDSLDAAKVLHEALLPGWRVQEIAQDYRPLARPWLVHLTPPSGHRNISRWASAETPARAWLIADLKALIAKLEATQ